MHHAHRVVGDAVVAADGDERITIGLGLYRVVADGITPVGRALTPLLATSHDERRDAHGSAPGLTVVGREGGIRPFPQRHGLAVLAVVVRGGLHAVDGVLEIVEPVESAVFVYPLQRLELVAEQRLASLTETLVLALGIEGIGGIGLIPLGVRRVADEVDGTHRAVGLDFACHAPYTSLLEGVVAVTVECHHEQPAVGSGVETHALVHDVTIVRLGDGHAMGSLIRGKSHKGLAPVAAVIRGDEQGLAGRLLLVDRVGEVFQVELAVPVGDVGSVVVGPAITVGLVGMGAIGAHHLYILSADGIGQSTIVQTGIAYLSADIAYRLPLGAGLRRCRCGHERNQRDKKLSHHNRWFDLMRQIY